MPRYFFHHLDSVHHTDEEGTLFPSDAAAWEHGTNLCAGLVRALSPRMPAGEEYRLECIDETGRGVFAINWAATVLLQNGG